DLNAISQDSILQSGALIVTGATTLTADTTVGVSADLTTTGNDFNTVSLASTGGGTFGTVSVKDTVDAMSIGGNAVTLTANAAGPLTLTGGTYTDLNAISQDSILQSGALIVSGTTTLTADTNPITADLSTQPNNFNTVTTATTNSGSFTAVSLNDTGTIDLGAISAGMLSVTAGTAITTSGAVTTTGEVSLTAGTDVTVSNAIGADGIVTIDFGQTAAGVFTANADVSGSSVTINGDASGDTFNINVPLTANLNGAAGDDTFILGAAGSLSGTINGGTQATAAGDVLNVSGRANEV
ncbi:MAG: hypothetical protein AABM33_05665, partial [Pseudomonadota bacterium]